MRAIKSFIVKDQLVAEQSEPVRYRRGDGLLSLRGDNELHPLFSGDLEDWDAMAPSVGPSGGSSQISPAQNISESEDFEHVDWTASNITFNTFDARIGPDNIAGSATLVEATSTTGTLTISPSGTDEEARSLFIKDASDAVIGTMMPGGDILASPISPWIRIISVGSSRWARYSYDGVLIDASDPPPDQILVTDEYINGWFRVGFSSPASSGDYQIEIAEGFAYIFGANASNVPVSGGRLPRYTKDNEDWETTTLQPFDGIDSARLVYSSVKIDDVYGGSVVEKWLSSETYASGEFAYLGKYVYRSNEDANQGNNPEEDQLVFPEDDRKWTLWQTLNRWRMFDELGSPENRTVAQNFLQVIVQSAEPITSLGVGSARGSHVKIEVMVDGQVTYTSEAPLENIDSIIDPWAYHFYPQAFIDKHVDFNLPGDLGSYISMTITGEGEVACGKMVVGIEDDLGCAKPNPVTSINNLTTIERFQGTGDITRLVAGRQILSVRYDGQISTDRGGELIRIIDGYRNNPTFFVASENKEAPNIYGLVRNFDITTPAGNPLETKSTYRLEVIEI